MSSHRPKNAKVPAAATKSSPAPPIPRARTTATAAGRPDGTIAFFSWVPAIATGGVSALSERTSMVNGCVSLPPTSFGAPLVSRSFESAVAPGCRTRRAWAIANEIRGGLEALAWHDRHPR